MEIDDNRCQSMTIHDDRKQSMAKNTNSVAIDWSSISDINRLIIIDCHRLSLIVIDYRFHRLIRPGNNEVKSSSESLRSLSWRYVLTW